MAWVFKHGRSWVSSVVPVVALVACSPSDGGTALSSTGVAPGSGSAGDGGDDEAGDGVGEEGGGPVLDTPDGSGNADDGAQAPGCEKVDLLFVIDDSISMAGEQQNLVNSFPEFIDGIRTQLADVSSYHVGVITTNAYEFNETGCQSIGALVTQTGGANSSGQSCGPFSEGRFVSDIGDLESEFACIAQVGTDGPVDERPMQAMQIAIGPALAGAGGCNAGFIRPDALLVVVVVTDEEDDLVDFYDTTEGSPGDPQSWHDAVVAVKGREENVAVLSIIGGQPGNVCPEPYGVDGAEDAPRLRAFTELFTHGFLGDVCAPSYGPIFNEAIGVVETACGEFIPPAG